MSKKCSLLINFDKECTEDICPLTFRKDEMRKVIEQLKEQIKNLQKIV